MHLNHLDLPVPDLRAAADFFTGYLGFETAYEAAGRLAILVDSGGFRLALSALPPGEHVRWPTGFYIGYVLDSETRVHDLHRAALEDGHAVTLPLAPLAGALTFHLAGPGGVTVEISARR